MIEAHVCCFLTSKPEADARFIPVRISREDLQLKFCWGHTFGHAPAPDMLRAEVQFVLLAYASAAGRSFCPPRVQTGWRTDSAEHTIRRGFDDEIMKYISHSNLETQHSTTARFRPTRSVAGA